LILILVNYIAEQGAVKIFRAAIRDFVIRRPSHRVAAGAGSEFLELLL
jgi:hypothetical protein